MKTMSNRTRMLIEHTSVTLCIISIAFMSQPFSVFLYTWGFVLLLIGGLTYIYTSFFPPPPDEIPTKNALKLMAKMAGILIIVFGLGIILAPRLL